MSRARTFTYWSGRVSNFHFPGDKPDIFIISTPRSGSTLLMEVLLTIDGVKAFNEPLSVIKPVARQELGVDSWADLTTLEDREAIFGGYFQRLRDNKVPELNRPIYWKYGRLITRRIVFKILHGGEDMIPWFKDRFGGKVVVLLRHPIPTTLSHRGFPRLPYFLKRREFTDFLGAGERDTARQILDEGDHFEKGILNWALQNMFALRRDRDTGVTFIAYEDLTVWPEQSLAYLAQQLALPPIREAHQLIARPSRSTVQSDKATRKALESNRGGAEDRRFLAEKWRARITDAQEARAFEILDAFGIDAYERGSAFPTARYRVPGLPPAAFASEALSSTGSDSRSSDEVSKGVREPVRGT